MPDLYEVPTGKVTVGTKLIGDAGFTCLSVNVVVDTLADETGELYVQCKDGRHYLEGQLDDAGENYIGFKLADETSS